MWNRASDLHGISILNGGDSVTEERKHAILFSATILGARKLKESGIKPWLIRVTITDAIDKAKLILEKIDERWTAEAGNSKE